MRNLRYSDLVYLLNILKLQRAKFEDKDCSRNRWLEDIQLAISVAMSVPSSESSSPAEISNKVLDIVLEKAFNPQAINLSDLCYEHFIGPLVTICFSGDSSNDCDSIVKLCYDQFERYYAKAYQNNHEAKRSSSYSGKA